MIYESRLEPARLMLADFDRGVSAVAAQPFWLRFRTGGRACRHVPDFPLVRAGHSVLLVNVSLPVRRPARRSPRHWNGRGSLPPAETMVGPEEGLSKSFV